MKCDYQHSKDIIPSLVIDKSFFCMILTTFESSVFSFPVQGFESDDDIFSSDSDDDRVRKRKSKIDDRRKNQRMWTLSEVMKLIDGISQFGVGKWTDIKRLLFSSSSHRTPIDLRVFFIFLYLIEQLFFFLKVECLLPVNSAGQMA